jgi:ethanolamine ammonia-lyase large subunit
VTSVILTARQAEVAASGVTPLEVMLDNMRSAYHRALELERQLNDLPSEELEPRLHLMGEIARQRQIAQKCAADTANYVHPKRANIQHGSAPTIR